MKKTIGLLLLVAVISAVALAGTAQAGLVTVIDHTGNTDPTTEGWTQDPTTVPEGVTIGPITDDGGYDAWQVVDTSSNELRYQHTLSSEELTNFQQGWKLSARVRIVNDGQDTNNTVQVRVDDAVNGLWAIGFGSQSDGDPILKFIWGHTYTLEGYGPGYHLYELINLDGDDSAVLSVDGHTIASESGHGAPRPSSLIAWGSLTGASPGNGRYNTVTLEVVPEPVTAVLLVAGGIGCFLRRKNG
jgi:hypothetical protein